MSRDLCSRKRRRKGIDDERLNDSNRWYGDGDPTSGMVDWCKQLHSVNETQSAIEIMLPLIVIWLTRGRLFLLEAVTGSYDQWLAPFNNSLPNYLSTINFRMSCAFRAGTHVSRLINCFDGHRANYLKLPSIWKLDFVTVLLYTVLPVVANFIVSIENTEIVFISRLV